MDKKKLKIVFLCRGFGIVNRGVETYVLELSKRLSVSYKVDILSGKDADSLGKIIPGHYDLVIPTNGRLQALKASLGRLVSGYKTLISGQSGVGRDDIWNIAATVPNIYVALTEFEMEWAKKWAWKTKLVKIPNGVDLKKFSPLGEKAKINLPHPIILSVGVLEWYKHHERTIQAMKHISKGSLLIAGQGPEKEKLTLMGEKILGKDRFRVLSVKYEEIPSFYRAADLFVLPSWDREAFGIVYVEALASNLPIVAPDDSPRREIIGDAGLFVDVCSAEKYSQAIEEALDKKWTNLPRQQAEKFSWDEVARQYEKLFEEIFS